MTEPQLIMIMRARFLDRNCRVVALMLAVSLVLSAQAQTLVTITGGRLSVNEPDYGYIDGDLATAAKFHTPLGLAVDSGGNLFVADTGNNAIRKLDFGLQRSRTVISGLSKPVGVAFDSDRNLFVLNQGDGTVLRYDGFDSLYQFPTQIAQNLASPTAFALAGNTNLYLVESGGVLRVFDLVHGGQRVVTSGFTNPSGVAVLGNGLVVVSDTGANRLQVVDPRTATVVFQIGSGSAGYRDGAAGVAMFHAPQQVLATPSGEVVVADRLNHRVRLVGVEGTVTTLYGIDSSFWEGPCYECDPMILPGWYDGVDGQPLTAEAREPAALGLKSDGTLFSSELYYHIIRRLDNGGFGSGGTTNVTVLPPTFQPTEGYYPMGIDIQVSDPNTNPLLVHRVLYTTDASEPDLQNPTARLLTMTNGTGVIQWRDSVHDLSNLRVKAMMGDASSETVSGQSARANQIGFTGDITAGVGSTPVLPLVVMLVEGQTLRSLQFVAEVVPQGSAPPMDAPLRLAALTGNDFVPVKAGSTNLPMSRATMVGGTSRIQVTFLGTNTSFLVEGSAVVAMIAVPLPAQAKPGDSYQVRVISAFGTRDGSTDELNPSLLPARSIGIANIPYLVGDTTTTGWYVAGSFGDGFLRNGDVNNTFHASLGIRVPPAYTDVFDAMDVFPEDTPDAVGGDGRIRYLDWQILLDRASGFRTNSFQRVWSEGGVRLPIAAPSQGFALRPAAESTVLPKVLIQPLDPDARLEAVSIGQVEPGKVASVPVRLQVRAGVKLAGLQFRVSVTPEGLAPAVAATASFTAVPSLPQPLQASGLPLNEVAQAWSLGSLPLMGSGQGIVTLGSVQFQVPPNARLGDTYRVRVLEADGAQNLQAGCVIQPVDGQVGVLATAPRSATPACFRVRWVGNWGQRYVVESSSSLGGDLWVPESSELTGRGSEMEFIDQNAENQAKFYRIRLQP